MLRVAWLAVVVVLSLGLGACKSPEKAEPAKESGKPAEPSSKVEKGPSDAPEERLLAAMKDVADLLAEHKTDPKAAIAAVRGYSEKRRDELQAIVEALRVKVDAMSPEDQDVFWEKNTEREEYLLWDGAMRRFEDSYPDLYAELEELTNTIQSAGADHLVEDKDPIEAKALLTDAETAHEQLLVFSFEGELSVKLDEASDLLKTTLESYRSAASYADDQAVAVRALVRGAELCTALIERVRALPEPGDEKAKASYQALLTMMDTEQPALMAEAKKLALEHNVEGEFADKAKASN
ncbi:MAG: hypothetical protein RBU37_01130 [Myxococcota bacterium]|nr:hypothetical protein [Myxococcota bacterium]